jgi:hypothetical protein
MLFVNFSRGQLSTGVELPGPDTVVIELLSASNATMKRSPHVARWRCSYVRLDDFVIDERMRPLRQLASIVKIDVLNRRWLICEMSPTTFGRVESDFAERVETGEPVCTTSYTTVSRVPIQ